MDVTPLLSKGQQMLGGYGGGGFKINNEHIPGSRLLLPDENHAWPVTAPQEITLESLAVVAARAGTLDLLIIGSGKSMSLLPHDIREFFRERAIAVEIMDTGAACRTYNILLSEGRRVAAALIAV